MRRECRDGRLSRAEFIRRAAGTGLVVAAGGGLAFDQLIAGTGEAAGASTPTHRFVTRPDLRPARLTSRRGAGDLAEGLLFATPALARGQQGPLILGNDAEPLWYNPTTPLSAVNFRVAAYRGKPVLTWWEGTDPNGLGRGTHVIADDHYRVIARVPAGRGRPTDLHEFLLSPEGTALVTSWESVERDLRAFGGPRSGEVIGGVVQEIEIPSGRVLFEWRSLEHVALDESHSGYQRDYGYFDYLHLNSIATTDDGQLLVSARNSWTVYKLDRGSGAVIWRLGGKRSDFSFGPGAAFAWQHDARPHGAAMVSLFDDGSAPRVQSQSRGLFLTLDERRKRVTLERAFAHTPPLLAWALGSTQLLPTGNVLVGFGTEPYFTEFGPDGTARLDIVLPASGQNYRALRFPWVGQPLDAPRLARSGEQLYVSWNGATEVASWRLETAARSGAPLGTRTRPRAGFETTFPVPARARSVTAVALDAAGRGLGSSAPLAIGRF